jgi:hypothetical protein
VAVDGSGNVYVAGSSDATWGSPVRAFTSPNDAFVAKIPQTPTAAPDGSISGRIVDDKGNPVEGVVIRLDGTQNRKTITDANGNYTFDNVETNGFYTVTPSRVNYNFNPFNRSISKVGTKAEAAFRGASTGHHANPLDIAEYFVRQQYVDILGREPEEGGFNYWSDQILACNGDADCIRSRAVSVAAAFFIEQEAQQTGSGRKPTVLANRRLFIRGFIESARRVFAHVQYGFFDHSASRKSLDNLRRWHQP